MDMIQVDWTDLSEPTEGWFHTCECKLPWWRHQMETFSALLAFCVGNSVVTGEFPAQRSVTRSFVFSLICAWTDSWANRGDAGDLRRHHAHYEVIVMHHCSYRCSDTWRHQMFSIFILRNILLQFIDMTDIVKIGSYIEYSLPKFQHEILWMLCIHIDDL